MTTVCGPLLSGLLAIRFDLDAYTNMWNSPQAALLFWGCFAVVVLVVVGLLFWLFRRMRPH
jgi:hypothetical protein